MKKKGRFSVIGSVNFVRQQKSLGDRLRNFSIVNMNVARNSARTATNIMPFCLKGACMLFPMRTVRCDLSSWCYIVFETPELCVFRQQIVDKTVIGSSQNMDSDVKRKQSQRCPHSHRLFVIIMQSLSPTFGVLLI